MPAKRIKRNYQQQPRRDNLYAIPANAYERVSGRTKYRHAHYKLGMPILLVTDLIVGESVKTGRTRIKAENTASQL